MTDDNTRDRAIAMCLRLCSQILIKLHCGTTWGVDEEEMTGMVSEVNALANAMDPRKEDSSLIYGRPKP